MFPFAILILLGIGTALALAPSPNKNAGGGPPAQSTPNVIEADLQSGWGKPGAIPMEIRRYAAVAEYATGIAGLARALAVHWWSAWRKTAPDMSVNQIAEKAPTLCLECFTPDSKAAEQLDVLLKKGYPKPAWPDGWAEGRFGLGGMLGPQALYAGADEARVNGKWLPTRLPLLGFQAAPTMFLWYVQSWLGAVFAARALRSPTMIGADATNTWGNVFSMVADPDAYAKGDGLKAKMLFLDAAEESGVVLDKAPKAALKPMSAVQLWAAIEKLKDIPIIDIGEAPPPVIPPKDVEPLPAPEPEPEPLPVPIPDPAPTPDDALPITLPGGLSAMMLPTAAPAGTAAPMIVALHGRDADVGALMGLIPPNASAHAFLLRAPQKTGQGFQFFAEPLDSLNVGGAIADAAQKVVAAIRQLLAEYPTTRLVVVGHEQGGAIALRLAVLGMADVAVSSAGYLPPSLVPVRGTQATVVFVSGAGDAPVVAPTVKAFQDTGYLVYTNAVAGAGSSLSDLLVATRDEVNVAVAQLPPGPLGGFSFTPDCKIVVSSAPQSMRFLIPRVLIAAAGKRITSTKLYKAIHDTMTINDAACVFVPSIKPADPMSAVGSYLISRQVVTTLLLRGQLDFLGDDLTPEEKVAALAALSDVQQEQKMKDLAVVMVNGALNEAKDHGAPGELPQLGV